MIKRVLLNSHFVLISLFFSCVYAQKPDQSTHIYILMGQSNMAGRGIITEEYAEQKHERVIMLDKENRWVTAKHPLHFDKPKAVGVGPGLSFGIEMAKANPNAIIGLVPCAVGGTPIRKWRPGAYDNATKSYPYDEALVRIKEAMKKAVIKGIIWHQGEGDSNADSARLYLGKLTELISRVRNEVGDPQLPFVVGELGRYRDHYDNINRQLSKLPENVPFTAVAFSEGLWHKGDGTHFDSRSANELGKRFAAEMLRLQ